MIVDLFAGPGGWDTGLRMLGITDVYRIENDEHAHATATAAGHHGILADITTLDPRDYIGETIDGEIASPPCPGFSRAGKGEGRKDLELILAAAADLNRGIDPATVLGMVRAWQNDERSALTLEPLHWALATRPNWIAFEQVPDVLPIWTAYAKVLRDHGYNAWAGLVHAEQYGVPQTRTRASMLASLNQMVTRPSATHSRYNNRNPERLEHGFDRWVSWGEALDWRHGHLGWLTTTTMPNAPTRPANAPAPTVAFGNDAASFVFHDGIQSVRDAKKNGTAKRITVEEAAILQTFPTGYPWRGSKRQQYLQVSNAVPPLLAAHLLAELGVGQLPITNDQLLETA